MTKFLPFSHNKNCPSCHHQRVTWPVMGFRLKFNEINLADYKIIDIRESSECRLTQLTPSDYHIPLSELIKKPFTIPDGQLLLYCQTGVRSEYASYYLQKNGFPAFSLEGGVRTGTY